MASQFYVPGPTIVQFSTGVANALQFAGFAEEAVRVSVGRRWEDVHTDYAGTILPADCSFQGMEAFVVIDFSRYVETVISSVAGGLYGATEGSIAANAIGTLPIQEGFSFRVLLQCAYAAKTGYSSMVPAYNFPTCFPVDNMDFSLSTRIKKPRLVFRAIPSISVTTLSGVCYNNSTTGSVSPS